MWLFFLNIFDMNIQIVYHISIFQEKEMLLQVLYIVDYQYQKNPKLKY